MHPEAQAELDDLPDREATAVLNAITKLRELGPDLPFPHSSNVASADNLRELRPRAGRSPWRAFYRPLGDVFVIAAVGPEAQHKPKGFIRAVEAAEGRLIELEED